MKKKRYMVYAVQECYLRMGKHRKSTEKNWTLLPVKIGVTDDIDRRIAEMQTGNPRALYLRAFFPVDSQSLAFDMERRLHRFFQRERISGEWFKGAVLSEVQEISAIWNKLRNIDASINEMKIRRKQRRRERNETRRIQGDLAECAIQCELAHKASMLQ